MDTWTAFVVTILIFTVAQPRTIDACACARSPLGNPPSNCPPSCTSCEGITFTLSPTQDVWLEGNSNKNNRQYMIVGKHPGFPKKRTLIQFEDLPQICCACVKSAKMFLYFYGLSNPGTTIPREFNVHQIKKEWKENEATSTIAQSNPLENWNVQYVAIDGQDAVITPTDCTTIYPTQVGSYIELDITEAMQNWNAGEENHGVLIWATNEDTDGSDFRIYSREHPNNKPFVHVMCI